MAGPGFRSTAKVLQTRGTIRRVKRGSARLQGGGEIPRDGHPTRNDDLEPFSDGQIGPEDILAAEKEDVSDVHVVCGHIYGAQVHVALRGLYE